MTATGALAPPSFRAKTEYVRCPGDDSRRTQTFDVLDENRRIEAVDGVINDTFDPLAVHVYITAPEGWGPAAEQPLVW